MSYIRSRKHASASAALPLTVGTAAALTALAALPARADTVAQVSEVSVTAAKTYKATASANAKATADLLDTPQTVNVIGQQLIREQGATNLTEALQNSPGVGTFYLGENGNTSTGDAIYMRGSDVSGSIFVDGVRDIASVSRDVFNVEQIEVLKGAAGVDIGRGAATGAISLYTKQPILQPLMAGAAGVGGDNYKRGTADVNVVFGQRNAFRLNLMGMEANVPGRDRVKNSRWGVAPSLGFGLGAPTRLYLDYWHIKQDNIPDGGVSTIGLPGYTSPDPARPFIASAPRVDRSNFYGTNDDHDNSRTDMATAIVEHDFSGQVSIRNLTRWAETNQNYQLSSFMASTTQLLTPNPADPNSWTITRNINNKDVRNDILINQTNVKAAFKTAAIEHSVSTGLEFIREDQKNGTFGTSGAYPPVSLYHPNPNVTGYSRLRTGYTEGVTNTIGAYVNDSIKLTEAFRLSGGVRLDHYETSFDTVAAAGKTTLKAKGDLVSGVVGLVWKPAANGSVYASYALTQQPPGGANFTLSATNQANANNPNVKPQTAETYEVGSKWDLVHDKLAVTGAVYRTQYSDQILQDTDGTYYRTGRKSVTGVELGAVGQITKAWAVNLGYTYMDTRVQSPTNAVVTADGSTVLAYSPTDSFTVWSTYQVTRALSVGGGAVYNGKMKRGSDGAIGTPKYADAYWVANAYAAYKIAPQVELQVNLYNLLDQKYVASINKSGYRYMPGAARTARVSLNVSF